MGKIKIMHVAECAGGVDRYIRYLIKNINHDKFENIIVLSQLYNLSDYEKIADHTEQIHILRKNKHKMFFTILKIRKLIKKYSPEIVYAHSSIAGALTRLACIGLSCKVIYNPHGWSFNMITKKKKIYVIIEKILAQLCDGIICISEAEKKSALYNRICSNEKLYIINNGIDIDIKPSKTREELGVPTDAFVIGMVGRISKQKAPDTFINIGKYIDNAYFLIVGDTTESEQDEFNRLKNISEKYDIKFKVTGWVKNPIDYIGIFDVACLLSRWEGFGLALAEYMLCEKPIVATNIDAIPYIIKDEVNGILVNVDDAEAAAKAITKIKNSKEIHNRLISNGKKIVIENYDIKRMVGEFETLIEKLI